MSIEIEIKAEATRQRITSEQLAQRMGTYPERLSRAYSGERPLYTAEAERAAQVLGIPLSKLVRRAEERATKAGDVA